MAGKVMAAGLFLPEQGNLSVRIPLLLGSLSLLHTSFCGET